ncbi:unnamed protein product [Cladocopium goreaui]|uniref:Uncharacterized protein n=1 Tax=Cladocopium goreaui TaxID=2562237 RepID=A0A9P1FZU5_9DINO|nr:unnamed protein product [Cladocopium goreaui]
MIPTTSDPPVFQPFQPIRNEAAVQNGEGPVFLEAFVAKKLRPHQRDGVRFMRRLTLFPRIVGAFWQIRALDFANARKNSVVHLTLASAPSDKMGLGKSLQALALLWVVLSNNLVAKAESAVIVCPSSLCGNWRAEVKKWLGEQRLKPTVVESGKEKTELQLREFRDFGSRKLLIVSYDQLRRHVQLVDPVCELLICDEGHRLRSQGTATTKTLGQMQCQRRILLSGTPLQNDLEELFHCGRFVRPDLFAPSRHCGYMAPRIAAQVVQRAREPYATAEEKALGQQVTRELEQKTSQFLLRRTMENVSFGLPPRVEVVLRLRLAPTQVAAYQALLADLHSGPQNMAKALKVSPENAPRAMMALRLLCNDPADLLQDGSDKKKGKAHEEVADNQLAPEVVRQMLQDASGLSAKSLVLLALLHHWRREAPTDRVVVVSNFSRSLRRLQRLVPFKCSLLSGDTVPAKRMAAVEGLNTPGPEGTDVLLLSSKAGGTGLNLIGANRLILFDPDWNPANDAQAMARIWRQGQTKPCFIYRFVLAGTLEDVFLGVICWKFRENPCAHGNQMSPI